ncbi:hypothetical protein NL676_015649 [Syzygium grande]|nr:hypothetical protein NL676_015649 [Syzygium grande]
MTSIFALKVAASMTSIFALKTAARPPATVQRPSLDRHVSKTAASKIYIFASKPDAQPPRFEDLHFLFESRQRRRLGLLDTGQTNSKLPSERHIGARYRAHPPLDILQSQSYGGLRSAVVFKARWSSKRRKWRPSNCGGQATIFEAWWSSGGLQSENGGHRSSDPQSETGGHLKRGAERRSAA